MIKPLSPDEADEAKAAAIPDFVIEAINGILATGKRNFTQDEAILAIQKAYSIENGRKPPRDRVFKEGWLDFEPIFRKAGWRVVYDKPGYCEDYAANFTFSKGSK